MTDVSKILTGLDCCIDSDIVADRAFCPRCLYNRELLCRGALLRDARDLLKTLNPPEIVETKVARLYKFCSECGEPILNGWEHCAHCGAKLEEGEA